VSDNSGISFNWDIHWACNYNCPYCWFYGKWEEIKSRNVYHSSTELLEAWGNIHKKYGSVKISITGGEPFIYPGFMDFIEQTSDIHKFQIITNLSADIDKFVSRINKRNVSINPSFHPLSADTDEFIDKALLLKSEGLTECITFLAWPPLIEKLRKYQELFDQKGLTLTLQSFYGEYNKRAYPDSYTAREKEIICPQMGSRGGEKYSTSAPKTKGRLCNAGRIYGVVHPDGTVQRCGGINSGKSIVGNLFDVNFKLNEDPLPCSAEMCPCNEWAFLLESKP
jgi:organic radical activating enzyme